MNFKEFQQACERTASSTEDRLTNFTWGLFGETGEVVDYIKKVKFHRHPMDKEKLAEEMGDVLWYLTALATTEGLDLEEIAIKNIDKLKKRYPEKFSAEKSIARVV